MTLSAVSWEHHLLARAHAPLEEQATRRLISTSEQQLARAYALCQEITKEHSRTFYLAAALMPAEKRKAIHALYAFCRISDDMVDGPAQPSREELAQWQTKMLDPHPSEDDLVALAWADTCAKYQIPQQYAAQLLEGVARDLSFSRFETFAELADYCYGVASTVGLMSMHIIGYRGREAIPYAIKLGVALQLTNILRDVGEDWENGRCYLPQDELAAFGLTEADIANRRNSRRWQAFMQFQIERTRLLFAEALPGIGLLDRSGRFAVAAAAELYQAILEDIEANHYDVFDRRAYVTKGEKLSRLPRIWWRAKTNQYAKTGSRG